MPCPSVYASALDYAVWFLCDTLVIGFDDSGGAGNLFLTDTTANFVSGDYSVAVGGPLYNATTQNYGKITGATPTVLQTPDVTWSNGDEYHSARLSAAETVTIETYLRIAAADITAALRSVNACDCSMDDGAMEYLRKLNVIDAAIFHRCPCGRIEGISTEDRRIMLDWVTGELVNIRSGETELCAGETGSSFPAIGVAEVGWIDPTAAQILMNYRDRTEA